MPQPQWAPIQDEGRPLKLQPPFYILTQGRVPGGYDWIKMNDSTSFWFTSKDAVNRFLIRTPRVPSRANWDVLHDWDDVGNALFQLQSHKLPYMLLDPISEDERRLWARDIFNQLRPINPRGVGALEVRDRLIYDIDVYCDESGKAPVNDTDDVLIVTALVVKGGRVSGMPTGRYKKVQRSVENIVGKNLRFASLIIKPKPGYKAALDKKLDVYKRVVNKNCELGIGSKLFTDGDQIRPSHFVWMMAMQSIINWTVTDVARQGNVFIERVRIFVNRINQTQEMENCFRRMLTYDGPQAAMNHLKARAAGQAVTPAERLSSSLWADKFRLTTKDQITMQFDYEKPFHGDRGFMRLADRIAHHTFRQFRNQRPVPEFFEALQKAGIETENPLDRTDVISHHDPALVEDWERRTGQRK